MPPTESVGSYQIERHEVSLRPESLFARYPGIIHVEGVGLQSADDEAIWPYEAQTNSLLPLKMPVFAREVFSSGNHHGLSGFTWGVAQLRKARRFLKLNAIPSGHANRTQMPHLLRWGSTFLLAKSASPRPVAPQLTEDSPTSWPTLPFGNSFNFF